MIIDSCHVKVRSNIQYFNSYALFYRENTFLSSTASCRCRHSGSGIASVQSYLCVRYRLYRPARDAFVLLHKGEAEVRFSVAFWSRSLSIPFHHRPSTVSGKGEKIVRQFSGG